MSPTHQPHPLDDEQRHRIDRVNQPSGATTTGMKGGGFYDAHSEYQRRVIHAGEAEIRNAVAS